MSYGTMVGDTKILTVASRGGQKSAQTRESDWELIDKCGWLSSDTTPRRTLPVNVAKVVTLIVMIVTVAHTRDHQATRRKCLIYVRLLDVHPHHNLVAAAIIITIIIIIAISLSLSLTSLVFMRQRSVTRHLTWLLRLCLDESGPIDQFGAAGCRERELECGSRVSADHEVDQKSEGHDGCNGGGNSASDPPTRAERSCDDLDFRQEPDDESSADQQLEARKFPVTSYIDRRSSHRLKPSLCWYNFETDIAGRCCGSLSYLGRLGQIRSTRTRERQNDHRLSLSHGNRYSSNATFDSNITSRGVRMVYVLFALTVGLSDVFCTESSSVGYGRDLTRRLDDESVRVAVASDRAGVDQAKTLELSQRSSEAVGNRWNFGQRLLALGNGLASHANRSSVLGESLVPIGGGENSTNEINLVAPFEKSKRDYETTQIGEVAAERRLFSIGDKSFNGTKKLSGLARPNLSWDSWTKLLNFKDVNKSLMAATKFRPLLSKPTDSDQLQTSQTEVNFISGIPSDHYQGSSLTPDTTGGLRAQPAGTATSVGFITLPFSAEGSQETLSIGIMMQPTANETYRQASGQAQPMLKPQPDWSASNDIEHVIYAGPVDGAEAKRIRADTSHKELANKQTSSGNQDLIQDGERSKEHDEAGHWKREKSGSEGKQSQGDKAGKAADARLVDMGHDRHGWKNVYHKEEYAQHQKYHDVFRDKDWHNEASKYGQSHEKQAGSKFNESLAKSYNNQDKMGSKYDYHRGTGWKKLDEEQALRLDDEENQHQDAEEGEGKSANELGGRNDHHNSGSSKSNTFDRPDPGGNKLDDDAVLEQMKLRLEGMSEQFGDEGRRGGDSRKPSASQDDSATSEQPVNRTTRAKSSLLDQMGWPKIDSDRQNEGSRPKNDVEARDWPNDASNPTRRRGDDDGAPTKKGAALAMKHEATGIWNNAETSTEANDDKETGNDRRQSGEGRDEGEKESGDEDGGRSHNNEEGAKEAKIVVVKSGRPRFRPVSDQLAVRGEDKRDGLRLKLELNLDKSAMVNQAPAGGAPLYSSNIDGYPTGSSRGLTNSLGQKIRSSQDHDRSFGWPIDKASTRPIGGGPPIWQTTRIERTNGDPSVSQREHRPILDQVISRPSEGRNSSQSSSSPKDFDLTSRYPAKASSPVLQPSTVPAPSRGFQQQLVLPRQLNPNVYLTKINPTTLLGTRNKSQLFNMQPALMKQQPYGGFPVGLYGDDLTIRGPPSSNKLALTRPVASFNGIRSPFVGPSQYTPGTAREYLLLISKDSGKRNRNRDPDMQGIDQLISQLEGESQVPPTESFAGLSGPSYQMISSSAEPNVIFEASPSSSVYDSEEPIKPQALPPIEYHGHYEQPIMSSLVDHTNGNHRLQLINQHNYLREQQQRQQAELIDDQLAHDFSMAHLSYAAAPASLVQPLLLNQHLLPLGAIAVDVNQSGGRFLLINGGRGSRHVAALAADGTKILRPPPTVARFRSLGAPAMRPKSFTTRPPSNMAQQQQASSLNASSGQPQAWPVIRSLRNHLNMTPLGGLLRKASQAGQPTPSHPPIGSEAAPSSKHNQLEHPASSMSPISKWLSLPSRVIDVQHPQQRLKRYKQAVATAVTSYNVSHHSSAIPFDVNRWRQLREQANPSLRTNSSSKLSSGETDPMQANFSFAKISFLALDETKAAALKQHAQLALGQGRDKGGTPQLDNPIKSRSPSLSKLTRPYHLTARHQHQKITDRLRQEAQDQSNPNETILFGMKEVKLPPMLTTPGDSSVSDLGPKPSERQHLLVRSASHDGLQSPATLVASSKRHHPIEGSQNDPGGAKHNAYVNHYHHQSHQTRLQQSATKSQSQAAHNHHEAHSFGPARPFVSPQSPILNTYHHPLLIEAQLPIQIPIMDHISKRSSPFRQLT